MLWVCSQQQDHFNSGKLAYKIQLLICQYLNQMAIQKKLTFPGCFTFLLLLLSVQSTPFYDYTKFQGSSSTQLHGTNCNKYAITDFTFSSSSILTCPSTCTITNPNLNQVTYLDQSGKVITYTLTNAYATNQNFLSNLNYAFVFVFTSSSTGKTLTLAVPFDSSNNIGTSDLQQSIKLSTITDNSFATLKNFGTDPDGSLNSGIPLSAFNFLASISYNEFYEVADSSKTNTLLVSRTLLMLTMVVPTNALTTSGFSFTADYSTSDVLCWGAASNGQFVTHMRESIPLWFFISLVMLLWLFVLLSDETTPEVFERSFQNNKWTCWGLYSLFWLASEDFFTRMSRGCIMFITLCWQAMVISAIYSTLYTSTNNAIIIWAAVVAWAASIPFPFVLGGCFLQRIYTTELEKYQLHIDAHNQLGNKEKKQQMEKDAIQKEEHLYGVNYWYYASIMSMAGLFSITSVHTMQSFADIMDTYYYRNWQWLASVGIVMGWEHLIFEPLMTLFFGNKDWFRSRGYFYNSELAQMYKKSDF